LETLCIFCVCVCVCVNIHTHARTHARAHVRTHTRIHAHIVTHYASFVCIIYIYCMNASARCNQILGSYTHSFTVDVSPNRERKKSFLFCQQLSVSILRRMYRISILYVTFRCIVPYAFTWKCLLHTWTLNIFAKFMWGK